MSSSLAGKIFTIYSILLFSFVIWVFAPAIFYAPWSVGVILIISISIVVLSIIVLIKLFKKTNDEGRVMLALFIIYIASTIGLIIMLAISLDLFESLPMFLFLIVPLLSGLIYILKKNDTN